MQAILETLFDIVYPVTVVTLGIYMLRNSNGQKQYRLYGAMAMTLDCGRCGKKIKQFDKTTISLYGCRKH